MSALAQSVQSAWTSRFVEHRTSCLIYGGVSLKVTCEMRLASHGGGRRCAALPGWTGIPSCCSVYVAYSS